MVTDSFLYRRGIALEGILLRKNVPMEFMGAEFRYRSGAVPRLYINGEMVTITRGQFTWGKKHFRMTLPEEDTIDDQFNPVRRIRGMQIEQVEVKQLVPVVQKPTKKVETKVEKPASKKPREFAYV